MLFDSSSDDGYPNDWFVPSPPAVPSAAPPLPDARPNPFDSGSVNPAVPPLDLLAPYWDTLPASRVAAVAWAPPVFPDSYGRFWWTPPAPAPLTLPAVGLFASLANLQPTPNSPGLFGSLANLPPASADAPASLLNLPSGAAIGTNSNRPPAPFDGSDNLRGAPAPIPSNSFTEAPSGSVLRSASKPAPMLGYTPYDASPNLTQATPTPQLENSAAFPLSQQTGLTVGDSGQSDPLSHQSDLIPLDRTTWTSPPWISDGYPSIPTGRGWLQLAQNRERIDPEDVIDPLAPVRTAIYNSARYDLQQLQPSNYALSVGSIRGLGSALTIDEIGKLKYAYGIAQSTQPLVEQASRIFGLLDSRAQNHRTVAVLQTSGGTFIAGSGEAGLTSEQGDAVVAARAIPVPAAGEGNHAEMAALKFAENMGKPQFIAASRPFCPDGCRQAIQAAGGLITSPTTAVFPLNIPSVAFPPR
jgi:hypothetical protein